MSSFFMVRSLFELEVYSTIKYLKYNWYRSNPFETGVFKDKIIDLVETGNTQERIEEQKRDWEVPSYNTLGDISRQTHHGGVELYVGV